MSGSAPSAEARLLLGAMEAAVRDHVDQHEDLSLTSVEFRPGPCDLVVRIASTGPRPHDGRREVTLILSETVRGDLDGRHHWTGGGGPCHADTHSELAGDLAGVASSYLHGGGEVRARRSWSALGRRREFLVFRVPEDELWFRRSWRQVSTQH